MSQPIEFFFDIGSPYSYLAATQIQGVSERTGVSVQWRPFLLGGVFRDSGNQMPASVPAKARWMLTDMTLWSAHYGVPFRMSSHFPLNTLRTQRALISAEKNVGHDAMVKLAQRLFSAYWADDVDVSQEEAVAACANDCGLNGSAIVEGASDPAVKQALIDVTAEAVQRGAFGAPSLFVGDTLFWGQDRLPLIESHLKGLQR
jgi:2-hydroxychromene-2-carboxylate isomerase